ncbi:hypothetical protein D3C76_1425900 [compost metagenome]
MGVSQIADMDVVAHTSTVFCRIVISENCDTVTLLQSRLQYQRHQMTFWTMVFTDFATGMCASCIEVTQCYVFDAQYFVKPSHHPFHGQLSFSIHIGWFSAVCFFNRHLFRFAVGCGCGREYDLVHARFLHSF